MKPKERGWEGKSNDQLCCVFFWTGVERMDHASHRVRFLNTGSPQAWVAHHSSSLMSKRFLHINHFFSIETDMIPASKNRVSAMNGTATSVCAGAVLRTRACMRLYFFSCFTPTIILVSFRIHVNMFSSIQVVAMPHQNPREDFQFPVSWVVVLIATQRISIQEMPAGDLLCGGFTYQLLFPLHSYILSYVLRLVFV